MSYAIITIGNLLLTAAYAFLTVPNQIINGGVTSTSLLISHYLHVDISYISTPLTIILLIFGRIFLGKEFFIRSLYSSICYVIFFNFFHWTGITFPLPAFVCVVIAGVLVGLGHYLCLNQDSSTVGYDVIALYLHKLRPKWNPAIILRIIGMVILVIGVATFGIWSVVYGILFTIIQTQVIYIGLQIRPLKNDSNINIHKKVPTH